MLAGLPFLSGCDFRKDWIVSVHGKSRRTFTYAHARAAVHALAVSFDSVSKVGPKASFSAHYVVSHRRAEQLPTDYPIMENLDFDKLESSFAKHASLHAA